MKITPLKCLNSPRYPTMAELLAHPTLLHKFPKRWSHLSEVSAIVGMLCLLSRPNASCANEEKGTSAELQPVRQDRLNEHRRGESGIHDMAAIVAPILAESLKYDGRGSFGCVAINPPAILAEDEAMELIKIELESAGLKIQKSVTLSGIKQFEITDPYGWERHRRLLKGNIDKDDLEDDLVEVTEEPSTKFEFDMADPARSVYVEYISFSDYRDFAPSNNGYWSSVSSYDFGRAASNLVSVLKAYESDQKTVFGVFFDPLASSEVQLPDTAQLSPSARHLAIREYNKEIDRANETVDDKARKKLRKQVRHFIDFLRQEGFVQKPGKTR